MNNQIQQAVIETSKAAVVYSKALNARYFNRELPMPSKEGTVVEVQVGDNVVTVKASVGGNSRAQHVRVNYMLNGKRATAAVIEAL